MALAAENIVYIATSLDGYISGPDGDLSWLPHDVPESHEALGFDDFMETVDALVMGRVTFEAVLNVGEWPYRKPVFVLTRSLSTVPEHLSGQVSFVSGTPASVMTTLHEKGFHRLYIDGGATIRAFLEAGAIDRLYLTRVPILLGGGTPLFGALAAPQQFRHVQTANMGPQLVMSEYERVRT